MRNTFLKFFSLWEITLTKFVDFSIFSVDEYKCDFPKQSHLIEGELVENPN